MTNKPNDVRVSRVGLVGKYEEVLKPFTQMMEKELHANSGKGDRPGWLSMPADTCLLEIYYHLGKLQKAVKDGNGDGICEYAADVANLSMMLTDICGALALFATAQPADQQGEPVAIVVEETHNYGQYLVFGEGLRGAHSPRPVVERKAHLLDQTLPSGTKLYRLAQPATAKVVLPERMKTRPYQTVDRGSQTYASAWNACLDEVVRLNKRATST